MKLFYIANVRMPTEKAHGVHIAKMCEAFGKKGVAIELVLPRRQTWIKEAIFDYYSVRRNFELTRLFAWDLVGRIPRLGFIIENVSFSLACFFYLRKKKARLVYSRDLFVLFILSLLGTNNFILELHSLPKKFWLFRGVLEKAKKIVVITRQMKRMLAEKGINRNKILIAADGVDLKEFKLEETKQECRQKLNLPSDKVVVGYLGKLQTMEREKGISVLIRAAGIIKKQGRAILLCLAGGEEKDKERYEKIIQANHLEKDIVFTGHLKHRLVPFYLKSFDVAVMPFPRTRHYSYYMSPLKMFEYMAAGLPIVTSDLPCVREVLNENNAILVQPAEPADLARGIIKALDNPDASARISKQARQDVEKYTWLKRAEKIIDSIAENENSTN